MAIKRDGYACSCASLPPRTSHILAAFSIQSSSLRNADGWKAICEAARAVDEAGLEQAAIERAPGGVGWDVDMGRFKALVKMLRLGDTASLWGLPLPDPKKDGFDAAVEKVFRTFAEQRAPQPLLEAQGAEGGAGPPLQLQQQVPAGLPAPQPPVPPSSTTGEARVPLSPAATAAAAPPAQQPPTSVRQAGGHDVPSAPFGPGTSRYYESYLKDKQEQALLKWCRDDVRFQIYNCTSQQRVKGGEPRLKAPKAEFYLLDEQGRRPHYKWTQVNDFDHAGEPMPPMLKELCEQLNTDFGLEGDDRLNHCLIICNEQSGAGKDAHCAPPHADKIQKGFFVDLSLGYPRVMKLLDAQSKEEAASQALASGSLAYITADDNGRLVQGCTPAKGESKVQGTCYLHTVPVDAGQPRDQPRFSLVFRPITDHPKGAKCGEHLAKVDETKAVRVRPGGNLWREYVPLCRGGTGAAPAPEAAAPAGSPQPMEVEAPPAPAQTEAPPLLVPPSALPSLGLDDLVSQLRDVIAAATLDEDMVGQLLNSLEGLKRSAQEMQKAGAPPPPRTCPPCLHTCTAHPPRHRCPATDLTAPRRRVQAGQHTAQEVRSICAAQSARRRAVQAVDVGRGFRALILCRMYVYMCGVCVVCVC